MTTFAPTIEAYFTERLITQRQASPRTVAAYRDSLRMLLVFAQDRTGKAPSQLDVSDVDATLVGDFLTHLEHDRRNSARTRNTRLAAIHSLFRYAAYRHPEHAQMIQRVLAIPSKRYDKRELDYLEVAEVDALLAATDRSTWIGRRDHMLLVLAVQTGLRVSDYPPDHRGSRTRTRCSRPLPRQGSQGPGYSHDQADGGPTSAVDERAIGRTQRPGVPNLARTGPQRRRRAVAGGQVQQDRGTDKPSLTAKIVSPHVLRHTCAMNLLEAGVDSAVIALWLGRELPNDTDLHPRQHGAQGKGPRPNGAPQHQTRPIHAARHAPCVPDHPLIMPSSEPGKWLRSGCRRQAVIASLRHNRRLGIMRG